jgi:hypothetical protein
MSDQYTDPAEIRHRIGQAGSFSLNNISGDIRVRGTDTDEAVVVARSDRGRGDNLPLVVRRGEGSLAIELEQRGPLLFGLGWRHVPGVEFDVTLPRGARVEVTGVSSDIEVMALVGDQKYRSVSGDVSVLRAGGRVSLTSVSGDAQLHADEPVEADMNTTSGDLEMSGPTLRATRLRTVSGDVEIRGGFEPGAMHTIETVSGDVDIESTTGLTVEVRKGIDLSGGPKQRVVGDGSARLRFRSLSGDLHVMGVGVDRGVKDEPWPTPNAPTTPTPPMPPTPPSPRETPPAPQADSLEILRALERGEIDIEEAQRRLEGAGSRG